MVRPLSLLALLVAALLGCGDGIARRDERCHERGGALYIPFDRRNQDPRPTVCLPPTDTIPADRSRFPTAKVPVP